MRNIFSLKREAEKEAYKFFDENIRSLKKNKKGEVDNKAPGLVDNDVDAFRHAYVSGRYVQEHSEVVAKVLGDAQEVFPGGSSNPQNSDLSNGNIFDRANFVSAIESGVYPGYLVANIDGLAIPMSKPDGITSNNLG